MLGCGRPPKSICGGEASAIEGTPATFAGTTFMITLEASGASPPGTYKPTRFDRNHASAYDRAWRRR